MQGTRQLQRPTAETNSAAVSDTASFRQRETELKSIEKRFGRTHPRRDTTAPMVSKFREEFSEPRTRTSIISKNSILAKFHLQIPRIAKYPTQDIRRYSVRDTKCRSETNLDAEGARLGQHKVSTSTINGKQVTSSLGWESEDVANSVDPRQQTAVLDGYIPRIRRQEVNSSESLSYHKTSHIDHILHPKPRKEQGSTLKPLSRHENNSSRQSDISGTVLREWVNLMNDQDLKPRTNRKRSRRAMLFGDYGHLLHHGQNGPHIHANKERGQQGKKIM